MTEPRDFETELAQLADTVNQLKTQIESLTAPPKKKLAPPRKRKTAKESASERKEPWVNVVKTHVNMDNVRNGFFEIDWNEYFIVQLKAAGYGADGDSDETVVDQWFRDLVRSMLLEQGLDPTRGAGFINITKIGNNRSVIE